MSIITGIIKMIDETKSFGANGFRKREFVVTTNEQYPQHILVEMTQDKCDLLDKFNIGQQVEVSINIIGREWVNPQGETRYFNSIQAWCISALSEAAPAAQQQPFQPATNYREEEHDDLPF